MSIADRSVQTSWKGPLPTGAGALGNGSSGALVDAAAALCPVSRLFAGATISVDAQLA